MTLRRISMLRRFTAVLLLIPALLPPPTPLIAQAKGAAPAAPTDSLLLGGLSWRNIGPWRGGRVTTVAGVRGQPLVYYMGGTGGGGRSEEHTSELPSRLHPVRRL